MKNVLHLLVACLVLLAATPAWAQTKIGYTNLEVVLTHLPEVKRVEEELAKYHETLATRIAAKEAYAQGRLEEYQRKVQADPLMSRDEKENLEKELLKLDDELKREREQADVNLQFKRAELLDPVMQRVEGALREVAAEGGYKIILNQTTSAGVSTILFGPDDADVTDALFRKLGVPTPKER